MSDHSRTDIPDADLRTIFHTAPAPELHVDPRSVLAGGQGRVQRRRRLIGGALSGAAALALVGGLTTTSLPTLGGSSSSSAGASAASGALTSDEAASSPGDGLAPTTEALGPQTAPISSGSGPAVSARLSGSPTAPTVEQVTQGSDTRVSEQAKPAAGFGTLGVLGYRTNDGTILLVPLRGGRDASVELVSSTKPGASTPETFGSRAALGGQTYVVTWVRAHITADDVHAVYRQDAAGKWSSSTGVTPQVATFEKGTVTRFPDGGHTIVETNGDTGSTSGVMTAPSRGVAFGSDTGVSTALPLLPKGARDITLSAAPPGTTVDARRVGDAVLAWVTMPARPKGGVAIPGDIEWTAADGTRWVLPEQGAAHRR